MVSTMKNNFKRLISLFLCLLLVSGVFSAGSSGISLLLDKLIVTANAEDEEEPESKTYGIFTYTINEGEVTITGCDNSTTGEVVIPGTIEDMSVTSIGDVAFANCSGITSITLPESIKSIGMFPFFSCTGLTNIYVSKGNSIYHSEGNCLIESESKTLIAGCKSSNIPNNERVTSIGYGAFYLCTGLTNIIIPDNIISIGDGAFWGCSDLSSVTLNNGISEIGTSAFLECSSLEEVNYSGTQAQWDSINIGDGNDNLIFSTIHCNDGDILPVLWVYEVNDNKATITGYKATAYGEIVIPESIDSYIVSAIGQDVFYDCFMITSVIIPDSVKTIGNNSFAFCARLASLSIPNGVISIGDKAFMGCSSIDSISISKSVESIGQQAFESCIALKDVYYSGTKEEWGNIDIGSYNNSLYNATIHCTDGDIVPNSLWNYRLDNGKVIITGPKSEMEGTVEIPSSINDFPVTAIEDNAFEYYNSITEIVVPDGVTSIGDSAFKNCTSLNRIILPDSVTKIGMWAFENTSYFDNNSNWIDGVLYIGNHLIKANNSFSKENYEIKPGTVCIADKAFTGMGILECLTVPNSVVSIGVNAFLNCSGLNDVYFSGTKEQWDLICISEGNDVLNYATIHCSDGDIEPVLWLYEVQDNETIITGYRGKVNEEIIIPESINGHPVISIGDYAFWERDGLKAVRIPDSVTSIGLNAFNRCYNLKDVYYNGNEESWNGVTVEYGNTYLTDAIHWKEDLPEKEPTCTKDGYSAYSSWSNTDPVEYVTQPEIKPATGHKPAEAVTENGESECKTYSVVYCSVCGEEISRKLITAHTPGEATIENTIPETCTKDGQYDTVVYCSICYEELSRETVIIPAKGHTPTEAVIENEEGVNCSYESIVYCNDCGDEISREHIVKHTPGRTIIKNNVQATCTESGHYDRVILCRVCNKEISREQIETDKPKGHCFTIYSYNNDATLDNDGTETAICDNCGKATHTRSADGTKLKAKIYAPKGIKTINWKYKVRLIAEADELPSGCRIVWFEGDTMVSDGEDFTTENLNSSHTYTAKIIDDKGNVVSEPSQEKTVTVEVEGSFFLKLVSLFKRILGLNTTEVFKPSKPSTAEAVIKPQ